MRYRVNLAKSLWYTAEIEADSEEEALEEAYNNAPGLCAQCGGWRQKWNVSDDDEWQSMEEYLGDRYDEKLHGKTVESD